MRSFLLLFCLCQVVFSATYYISQNAGQDSWNGTQAAAADNDGPKQSISAANDILNNTAQPGDSVLFKRGDTWTASSGIALSEAVGTPDSLIVVGAYGTGDKPVLDISGTGNCINIRGSYTEGMPTAYVRFENLKLTTSAAPGNRPVGIYINETYRPYQPHHIYFDSLEIIGLKHGLTLYLSHHVLENSLIKDNYGIPPEGGHTQGIYVQGHHITIRNNIFDHNGKDGSWFDHNMYMSAGTHYLIEGNEFRNALDGIKLRKACSTIVRDNHIHHMNLSAINVGGDDQGGINTVTIENNLIHNTVDGIQIRSQSGTQTELTENLIIRNNILYNNQLNAPIGGDYPGYISVLNEGPLKDIRIYNNLVYGCEDEHNLYINVVNPQDVDIRNNIFCRTSTDQPMVRVNTSSGLSGITLDNNLYYFPGGDLFRVGSTEYTTLADFQAAHTGQAVNAVSGDPAFQNAPLDFHLTAASTNAIDKGADLAGFVDQDRDGAARPADGDTSTSAEWDIGPYEFNGEVSVQTALLPDRVSIVTLFPNPVTRGTRLFTNAEDVEIQLYDLQGRRLTGPAPLAPGLYLARLLKANRTVAVRKITVR